MRGGREEIGPIELAQSFGEPSDADTGSPAAESGGGLTTSRAAATGEGALYLGGAARPGEATASRA